jgi:hypothetical protein
MNNILPSLKAIAADRNMWLIALAFAIPNGIQGSWQSVMAFTFEILGKFYNCQNRKMCF